MTLATIKTEVLSVVTKDWVRNNFGSLNLKSTWEDAYDRTRELALTASDVN